MCIYFYKQKHFVCVVFVCVIRCSSLTCSGTAVSTTSDPSWTPTSKTTLLERWHTSIHNIYLIVFSQKITNPHFNIYKITLNINIVSVISNLQGAHSLSEVVHGPLGWGRPTGPHPGSHEGKVLHTSSLVCPLGLISKTWRNSQTEGWKE